MKYLKTSEELEKEVSNYLSEKNLTNNLSKKLSSNKLKKFKRLYNSQYYVSFSVTHNDNFIIVRIVIDFYIRDWFLKCDNTKNSNYKRTIIKKISKYK